MTPTPAGLTATPLDREDFLTLPKPEQVAQLILNPALRTVDHLRFLLDLAAELLFSETAEASTMAEMVLVAATLACNESSAAEPVRWLILEARVLSARAHLGLSQFEEAESHLLALYTGTDEPLPPPNLAARVQRVVIEIHLANNRPEIALSLAEALREDLGEDPSDPQGAWARVLGAEALLALRRSDEAASELVSVAVLLAEGSLADPNGHLALRLLDLASQLPEPAPLVATLGGLGRFEALAAADPPSLPPALLGHLYRTLAALSDPAHPDLILERYLLSIRNFRAAGRGRPAFLAAIDCAQALLVVATVEQFPALAAAVREIHRCPGLTGDDHFSLAQFTDWVASERLTAGSLVAVRETLVEPVAYSPEP